MTSPITLHRHGDVLVIVSGNPPVNALGAAVRQGLESAIKEGVADASIAAMVIRCDGRTFFAGRSEEHTSELQSLMRISYAVFCLKKKKTQNVIDIKTKKV